jgi:hypothetical protein
MEPISSESVEINITSLLCFPHEPTSAVTDNRPPSRFIPSRSATGTAFAKHSCMQTLADRDRILLAPAVAIGPSMRHSAWRLNVFAAHQEYDFMADTSPSSERPPRPVRRCRVLIYAYS